MKRRMQRILFLLLSMMWSFIYADQVVIPEVRSYDRTNLPPSPTTLLRHEREEQEQNTLKGIEKVVEGVLKKQGRHRRKRAAKASKSIRDKRANVSLKKLALQDVAHALNKQTAEYARRIRTLIEQQYSHKDLVAAKLSLTIKNVSIKHAVDLISKTTGITFVVDADVEGQVREFQFKDFSLGSALYLLLNNNNPRLALLHEHEVWRVVRLPMAVECLQDEAYELIERDYMSECMTLYHARWDDDFKKRIEKLWQGIVGGIQGINGTYLVFDDVNRKVLYRGRCQQVKDFTQYLKEIDVLVPQVRIDARVVIAGKDFDETLGTSINGLYDFRQSGNKMRFAGIGLLDKADPAHTSFFNGALGWALNLIPATNLGSKTMNLSLPFVFGDKKLSTSRLNLALNAAENRHEIKTILKPSLLINNEEFAEILVGEELPHATRVDETIEGKPSNLTTTNYKDVGMKIKMKPVVTPDHQAVFLDVYVENSSVANTSRRVLSPSGEYNYTIETSRSKNRVLLKSGQTTLIGGLIVTTKEKAETGIPFLKEVPVLGFLFKGTKQVAIDKQLLIFITPTLI